MEDLIGKIIGGCTIQSKIGQGGMGVVYKAHHIALDIPVAVKILTAHSDNPDAAERFLREARIAAKMKHPNITSVLNVGADDDVHYIVMEFIDGKSLLSLLEERGRIPSAEMVPIALATLNALAVAHEHGIVHRDIKPENIMVDARGIVKLVDLGLARMEDSVNLTQPNTMLGSPYYVAPEQADNPSSADSRADIYSLGCTLYHALSGNTPFPGSTIIEVLMQHIKKPVPQLFGMIPGVSQELSYIIAKMMEKNPADRYQSPHDVIEAFSGNLLLAPARHPKISKKKENRLILAGTALLLIICIAIAYFWGKKVYVTQVEPVKKQLVKVDSARAHDSIAAKTDKSTAIDTTKATRIPRSASSKKSIKSKVAQQPERIQSMDVPGPDPVLSAVKIGDTDALRQLLEDGASPNMKKGEMTSPLHESVKRALTAETKLLLEKGASPNVFDSKGKTPLHYAISEDATYMAQLLLERGADPNLADKQGKTPHQMAVSVSSAMEKLIKNRGGK